MQTHRCLEYPRLVTLSSVTMGFLKELTSLVSPEGLREWLRVGARPQVRSAAEVESRGCRHAKGRWQVGRGNSRGSWLFLCPLIPNHPQELQ